MGTAAIKRRRSTVTTGDAPSTDDLRRRRAELDREITARERVEAA